MITTIDRNVLSNEGWKFQSKRFNTNDKDIDGFLTKTNVMGSSSDPSEIKLVPMVKYSIFLNINEIDKLTINSIKISNKDIEFLKIGKRIHISLIENDFSDDIVIDYNKQV